MMKSMPLFGQKKKPERSWEKQSEKKLVDIKNLEKLLKELRYQKKSIVTLNGSFDLLHAGHLKIIYEASLQGDILFVALNTDSSIKSYKGITRPIISLKYRLQMLSAIEFVDFVTYFEEPTPCELLKKIKPDVHVNGSEYGKDCIESSIVKSYGGRVHITQKIENLSTSSIIEKIKICES